MPVKTRDNSSTVVVLRASTHRDAVLDFGKVAVLLVPGFNAPKAAPSLRRAFAVQLSVVLCELI